MKFAVNVRRFLLVVVAVCCVGNVGTAMGQTVQVDNSDPGFSITIGDDEIWQLRTSTVTKYIGPDYRFANTTDQDPPTGEVQWSASLPTGIYDVEAHFHASSNRSPEAKYTITSANGVSTVIINQSSGSGSKWALLGTFSFVEDAPAIIALCNQATPGKIVMADAIRFTPSDGVPLTMAVSPSVGGTTTPAVGGPYGHLPGDVVDITATPAEDYKFVRWDVSGGSAVADPTSPSTTVTIDQSKTVTAVFRSTREIRAIWAVVFQPGYKSAAEVDEMVAACVTGNYNVIIAQMLAYQDSGTNSHGAYWNSSIVPKAQDITPSDFDPLAYLCEKAHAVGIEVHVMSVPFRMCNVWPPKNNPTLEAHPEWFSVSYENMGCITPIPLSNNIIVLDPGNPDAQEYLLSIMREQLTNYPIDGIHLDLEYVATGYYPTDVNNPKSGLARFKQITGYSGTPATNYGPWSDFRRRVNTEIMQRAHAEILGFCTPTRQIRLSVSVPGHGTTSDFTQTTAYLEFNDWELWTRKGYLDTSMPMEYDREHNSQWAARFRASVVNDMIWKNSRELSVGQAAYLNYFTGTLTQMQYVRDIGAEGISTYDYWYPRGSDSNPDVPFHDPSWFPLVATNFFTSPVKTPKMSWRDPVVAGQGTLWGRITDSKTGRGLDNITVQIGSVSSVQTDGNGYYVATLIPSTGAGTSYPITVQSIGYITKTISGVVSSGSGARYDMAIIKEPGRPPLITGVTLSDVFDTSATVSWISDEEGTTEIKYGTKIGQYTHVVDSTDLKKIHSMTLKNLQPLTTYYFVVVSCDDTNDCGESTVGQFSTHALGPAFTSGITVKDIGHNEATFSFTTDKPGTTQIQYGLVSGVYTDQATDATLTKNHTITVTNFQPGKKYYFVAVTCDDVNECATSVQSRISTVEANRVVDYIVESRSGGKNYNQYSDNLSNSTAKSSASGLTPGIGSRYGTASGNYARYYFTPTLAGPYRVYSSWGTSTNGGVIDQTVYYEGGDATSTVNQHSNMNLQNKWYYLGQYTFNAGTRYSVRQVLPYSQGGLRIMADSVKWVYIDPVAPVQPTGLTATSGEGEVILAWDENPETDIDFYEIYRGTTTGLYDYIGSTSQLAYNDIYVQPGTEYFYVIKAVDTSGNQSVKSDEASSTPKLGPPHVVNVTSSTPDGTYGTGRVISILVQFNIPAYISGFPKLNLETGAINRDAVYAYGSGTDTLTFLYTVQSGDSTASANNGDLDYTSTTALSLNNGTIKGPAGHDAFLTLYAPNTSGSLGVNANIVINGSNVMPAPLVMPEPAATAGTSNTIYWKPVNGAEACQVQCALDDQFAAIVSQSVWIPDTEYTFTGLTLGAKYYYRAATRNAEGNVSDWSNIVSSEQRERVAPMITDVTSDKPNGAYGIGQTIPVQITFDAPVTVKGTPELSMETGMTDRLASYSAGSGTNTLTFLYVVQSGDMAIRLDCIGEKALSLNGGSIQGAGAMDAYLALPIPGMQGSLSTNKNIVINTTAAMPSPVMDPEPVKTPGASNTVQWLPVAGATQYRVVCAVDAAFAGVAFDSDWIAETSYTFANLTVGQTYWYRVMATDGNGVNSVWSNVVSSQQVLLAVGITASAATITTGGSVNLQASVTGGAAPFIYAWTPTTGLSAGDVANPTATPTATTTYQVKVTDSLNQTAQADVTITVTSESGGGGGGGGGGGTNPPPPPPPPVTQKYTLTANVVSGQGNVLPTTGSFDVNTVVTLTAVPAAGYRMKAWSGTNNDGSMDLANAVTMSANRSVTVEFEPIPLVVTAGANATSIQAGQSVQLSAGVTGGAEPYAYSWSPASGLSNANTAVPAATPVVTSTYQVTVTDAIGQSAQASITITVATQGEQPLPEPDDDNESPVPNSLCGLGAAEMAILCAMVLMAVQGYRRRSL